MNSATRFGLCLAVLSACHGSGDQKTTSTQSYEATAIYDPAADLRLELTDGATLDVPAGAASEAGSVTFSRVTCDGIYAAPELPSCLYRVETALDFESRFEITLPRTSEEPGAVVERTGDGLPPLLDSVSGRTVTEEDTPTTVATASIATDFAVRDTLIAPPDMRCTDLDFTPCGGSVEGQWELVAACGTRSQVTGITSSGGTDPYASCAETDYLLDYPFEVGGKFEYSDGHGDWTSSWSIVWRHQIITEACLESAGSACGAEGGDCTFEDGLCNCLMEWTVSTTGSSGGWSDAKIEERTCVDGDTLTVMMERSTSADPYWLIYERG